MSDDKPTHTAEDLRKSANKFVEAFGSDARTASMLNAGADAIAALAKLSEPTPEIMAEIENHHGPLMRGELHPADFIKLIARAALEKPAGLGWKLSDEAKRDIAEIESHAQWGPKP